MKRIISDLAIILAVALILLGTALILQDITHKNTQKEHIWLMETLLPGAEEFEKIEYGGEDETIVSVHKANEGYIVETLTRGYADNIRMFIGLDNDGNVMGLVAYDAHETVGLGSRILTDHKFLSQFLNKSGTFTVGSANKESEDDAFSGATSEVETNGEEIAVDALSGATVSSKAVARCVNSAVAYVTGSDGVSSATSWGG